LHFFRQKVRFAFPNADKVQPTDFQVLTTIWRVCYCEVNLTVLFLI